MVNIGVREVKMLEVIATTEKGEVNFGNFFGQKLLLLRNLGL